MPDSSRYLPLVSVIIPTYKPGDYLKECLESLQAQTFSKDKFEVILVLNGCDEPYRSRIEDFKYSSDLNIVFIQTDRSGVSNARNIALNVVRGNFITFIDDDDYVSPSYLEELYKHASEDTVSLSNTYAFDDKGIIDDRIFYDLSITKVFNNLNGHGKEAFSDKVRKYFMGPCMKLIPVGIIGDRRFNRRFQNGEDALFMFLISDRYKYVDFTSKDAIYYRRFREGSAFCSTKPVFYSIKNFCKLVALYTFYWIKNPFKYNFKFFLTRLAASAKYLIKELKKHS